MGSDYLGPYTVLGFSGYNYILVVTINPDGTYTATATNPFPTASLVRLAGLGPYSTVTSSQPYLEILQPGSSEMSTAVGDGKHFIIFSHNVGPHSDVTEEIVVSDLPIVAGQVFTPDPSFGNFNPVCFCEGSRILTTLGEVVVEDLQIGDLVVTSSGANRSIRWLGHRTVDCRRHPRQEEANPIRIARHAFGEDKPTRDLYVSPRHCICVDSEGEVLIPVSALANGSTITQIEADHVTYWHVELDTHDILIANGLPAESYIDMGNRQFFIENGVVAFDVSPDAGRLDSPLPARTDFCRPLVTDGPLLDAVRAKLRLQAEALGWTMAHSPLAGLHLDVGNTRIDPVVRGLVARFTVPAGAGDAWLVSIRSRPIDVIECVDERYLGVCVAELAIDDGFCERRVVALNDPLLSTGFNLFEGGWRWTAGRAYLPAALWSEYRDGFFLRVQLTSPALPFWVAPVMEPVPELGSHAELEFAT